MWGYGSKLGGRIFGGSALVALAAIAGVLAGMAYQTSAPDRASWALFLSTALVLCALLGQVWMQVRRRQPSPSPNPARTALEPGQIVPWDAVILEGESEIDNGPLGGSVFASPIATGDRLRRGARNGDGRLQIGPQALSEPGQYDFSTNPAMLFPAIVNRHARRILLGLLVLAAAVAIRFDLPTAALAIAAAVPLSLGLIRAIVFDAAARRARKAGIGWRDAGALDALAEIDTIVLPPGGILTRTELTLLSLHHAADFKPAEVIAAASTCCQSSLSSLARATLRFAVTHRVRLRAIKEWRVEREPGKGWAIVADTDLGAELALGDRAWLERQSIPSAAFDAILLPTLSPGRQVLWIAELRPHLTVIGALVFGEKLKTGGAELAKNLKRLGVETVLLQTGASEGQLDLARQLGLTAAPDAIGDEARRLVIDRSGVMPVEAEIGLRLHFGMAQAQRMDGALAEIRREDPRTIVDLIRLARAARRRETIATLLAAAFCLPGLWFALGGRVAVEIATISPLLGLGAVIVSAQFLHLFQPTASEVDDE